MILIIDTSGDRSFTVGFVIEKSGAIKDKQVVRGTYHHAELLLPTITKLLKKNLIAVNDLSGIIVSVGPGGFTSLRIGVVTANALGFALDIPIAGLQKDDYSTVQQFVKEGSKKLKSLKPGIPVSPHYGREPNITTPKKQIK